MFSSHLQLCVFDISAMQVRQSSYKTFCSSGVKSVLEETYWIHTQYEVSQVHFQLHVPCHN